MTSPERRASTTQDPGGDGEGPRGIHPQILAAAGVAAGACLLWSLAAAGVFRPSSPATYVDMLPAVQGDAQDDRCDLRTYHAGLAIATIGAWIWTAPRATPRTPRAAIAIPIAALAVVCIVQQAWGSGAAVAAALVGVAAAVVSRWPAAASTRAAAPSSDPPSGGRFSRWDALALATIALLLWDPDVGALTASVLRDDHLLHWDCFAIGPATAAESGWRTGLDIPVIYGLGPAAVFGALARAGGYPAAIRGANVIEILYFSGAFLLVRRLGLRTLGAAAAVAMAICVQRFHAVGQAPHDLLRYPSATVVRHPLDLCWLAAILGWERSGRARYALAAGAIAAISPFWVIDTGIYLLGAHVVWAATVAIVRRQGCRHDADSSRRTVLLALVGPIVVAAGVCALWAFGPRNLLDRSVAEQVRIRAAGFGTFPIDAVTPATIGLFAAPALHVILGAAALRRPSLRSPAAAGWAMYGAGAFHYYVGRSIPFTWCRGVVPLVVTCILILREWSDVPGVVRFRRCRAPALAAVIVGALALSPHLHSRLARWGRTPAPAPDDAVLAGLTTEVPGGEGARLRAAIDAIRGRVPDGAVIAVISDLDVPLYRATATRSFSPRLPVLMQLVYPRDVDDVAERLTAPGVEYVFIDTVAPQFRVTRPLVGMIRERARGAFEHVATEGGLEVWRRTGAR